MLPPAPGSCAGMWLWRSCGLIPGDHLVAQPAPGQRVIRFWWRGAEMRRAVQARFVYVDDLSHVWVQWAEMEVRHNQVKRALEVLMSAVEQPVVAAGRMTAEQKVRPPPHTRLHARRTPCRLQFQARAAAAACDHSQRLGTTGRPGPRPLQQTHLGTLTRWRAWHRSVGLLIVTSVGAGHPGVKAHAWHHIPHCIACSISCSTPGCDHTRPVAEAPFLNEL